MGRAWRVHQPVRPVGLQTLLGQRDQLAGVEQQARTRDPAQGDAHTVQRGPMMRFGIIQHRHEAGRRALPTQGEPRAPRTVGITQQWPLRERDTVDAAHALDQCRAGHRQQPLIEQRLHHKPWPVATAQPQRGVELALAFEIHQPFAGLQIDLDLRMGGHEVPQSWHQPRTGHRRHRADRQHVLGTRRIRLEGFVDRIQMRADLVQQALTFQGEGDAARLADQQRLAQALFQLPHLVAERADREVHRRRRARQVAEPGGSDEALQGMQGWAGHKA